MILDAILEEQLLRLNRFEYKGETYPFSPEARYAAIEALRNQDSSLGLIHTNAAVYDLLTLGKSFEQTIDGARKSFTMTYIDWKTPENNVYHITDEFRVRGTPRNRRPDLVLFVNGIPFVVIECKRRDKNHSTEEAIQQNLRNQNAKDGIPELFYYAQLLLAV